jgi:hypothetical protein
MDGWKEVEEGRYIAFQTWDNTFRFMDLQLDLAAIPRAIIVPLFTVEHSRVPFMD